MFTICRRLLALSITLPCLSACAPLISMIGYSGSAVQVAVQLDRAKLLSDGVSYLGSGKTITDHAVSIIARADCRVINVVKPDPVCVPRRDDLAPVANERINIAALREELRSTAESALTPQASAAPGGSGESAALGEAAGD